MSEQRDALIIGGGPAGTTAALLLARAGWSVTVFEKKTFPRRKVCGEYISATTLPLLEELGLADAFEALAGPPITRVGLFAGNTNLEAPLPRPGTDYGRALSRATLDALLLDAAAQAGAEVVQPATVSELVREGEWYVVKAGRALYRSPIVIIAHGSWEVTGLPTQSRHRPRPDDLFGFKAHFTGSDLPEGLMPLLAFSGGYGGMVHVDGGRVSLSCCVRRDRLAAHDGAAGEAVFAHIMASCAGVRRALNGATREGPWLAAGPIRPGIRVRAEGGLFRVGNAAGEAHPVVAEGISMAMQGAWLLSRHLLRWNGQPAELDRVGRAYAVAWRRAFAGRLRASRVVAHWAMRPIAVKTVLPLLRRYPRLLTLGARASGKARPIVAEVHS